jgi:hypothetical protein
LSLARRSERAGAPVFYDPGQYGLPFDDRVTYDLSSSETDDQIGDGDVLRLTRTMRDHDTPAVGESILGSLDSLGDGTDLVDLEQKGVASLLLDGLLDEAGVGDGQVITTAG